MADDFDAVFNAGIEIPDELRSAMRWCELCEAACCGESAFELLPEHLATWSHDTPRAEIELVLRQIDELLAQLRQAGPGAQLKWFSSEVAAGPAPWLTDFRECVIEATAPPPTGADGQPIRRVVTAAVRVLTDNEYSADPWITNDPIVDGRIFEVLLPDRPAMVVPQLSAELQPGEQATIELRFPLPARVQPLLTAGGRLDIGRPHGHKTAEATIL